MAAEPPRPRREQRRPAILVGDSGADLADRRAITAAGMSRAFWPHGREAQSIAFFNAPGIERLYSGVTNRPMSALDRVRLIDVEDRLPTK